MIHFHFNQQLLSLVINDLNTHFALYSFIPAVGTIILKTLKKTKMRWANLNLTSLDKTVESAGWWTVLDAGSHSVTESWSTLTAQDYYRQ